MICFLQNKLITMKKVRKRMEKIQQIFICTNCKKKRYLNFYLLFRFLYDTCFQEWPRKLEKKLIMIVDGGILETFILVKQENRQF
jgi:hypothetical protein